MLVLRLEKLILEEVMAVHSSILAWRTPVDRGVWQAPVHRVTESWTLLKQLAHTQKAGKIATEPEIKRPLVVC